MMGRGENKAGRSFAGAWKRNWKRIAAGILVVVLFSNEMNWADIMVTAEEVEETTETSSYSEDNENEGATEGTESLLSGNDLTESESTNGNIGSVAAIDIDSDGDDVDENKSIDNKTALTQIQETTEDSSESDKVSEGTDRYGIIYKLYKVPSTDKWNAVVSGVTSTGFKDITISDVVEPANWTSNITYKKITVTEIGSEAFKNSNLNSITINSSKISIAEDAFTDCSASIKLELNNLYQDLQGITYTLNSPNTGKATAVGYSEDTNGPTKIIIPDYVIGKNHNEYIVTAIGSDGYKFGNNKNLESIDIPETVTSIGESAFKGCSELKSVVIPKSVTSIEMSAFDGCSKLESIEIPETVTSIGGDAFADCKSLKEIKIPNGIIDSQGCVAILSGTFYGCSGLTTVILPADSNISIEGSAFANCSKLTNIVNQESITCIRSYAFSGCTGLTSMDIRDADIIDEGAFKGCENLTSINISSAKTIEDSVFEGCTNLESVDTSGVTSIGESAFAGCTKLESVDTSSVTSIGESAFAGCTGLTSVDTSGVTSIGASAFAKCTSLETVTLPKNATYTEIKASTFKECTSLKDITIPENINTINTSAFQGCTSLKKIEIPNVTKLINDYAFADCKKLTEIEISRQASIGNGVFTNCAKLKRIVYQCSDNATKTNNQFISGTASSVTTNGDGNFEVDNNENEKGVFVFSHNWKYNKETSTEDTEAETPSEEQQVVTTLKSSAKIKKASNTTGAISSVKNSDTITATCTRRINNNSKDCDGTRRLTLKAPTEEAIAKGEPEAVVIDEIRFPSSSIDPDYIDSYADELKDDIIYQNVSTGQILGNTAPTASGTYMATLVTDKQTLSVTYVLGATVGGEITNTETNNNIQSITNMVNLTYYTDDGKVMVTKAYESGTVINYDEFLQYSKTGYEFLGWMLDPEDEESLITGSFTITEDTALYAGMKKIEKKKASKKASKKTTQQTKTTSKKNSKTTTKTKINNSKTSPKTGQDSWIKRLIKFTASAGSR